MGYSVPGVVAAQPALRAFEGRPPAVLGRSPHGRLQLRLPWGLNMQEHRGACQLLRCRHTKAALTRRSLGSTRSPMTTRRAVLTLDSYDTSVRCPRGRPSSGGQRLVGCNCPAAKAGGQRGPWLERFRRCVGAVPAQRPALVWGRCLLCHAPGWQPITVAAPACGPAGALRSASLAASHRWWAVRTHDSEGGAPGGAAVPHDGLRGSRDPAEERPRMMGYMVSHTRLATACQLRPGHFMAGLSLPAAVPAHRLATHGRGVEAARERWRIVEAPGARAALGFGYHPMTPRSITACCGCSDDDTTCALRRNPRSQWTPQRSAGNSRSADDYGPQQVHGVGGNGNSAA